MESGRVALGHPPRGLLVDVGLVPSNFNFQLVKNHTLSFLLLGGGQTSSISEIN